MASLNRRYGPGTALVVVDMQNDFADPAGSLYVSEGDGIVRVVNEEIERAIEAGSPVMYTQDWHPPITPHFQKDGGIWPVHCVAGSWGSQFHPGLEVVSGPVVRKGSGGEDGYSGFTVRSHGGDIRATELGDLLRERRIVRIVIAGLATDYCVKDTALDARSLGLDVAVVGAGIRAVDLRPGDGEAALSELAVAGVEVV